MNKISPSKNYREYLIELLKDQRESVAYLEATLEDGDEAAFMIALRDVVDAQTISDVAKRSGLNRENLYKMLSKKGNPRLSSLSAILNAVGLRLAVEVIPKINDTKTRRDIETTDSARGLSSIKVPRKANSRRKNVSMSADPKATRAR